MPRHVENLSLGLWTAPDPAKLENGQLSYLRNGVYLPGSQALQRARGRAQFGAVTANGASATATDIDGLRDVQFDNGDHYLIAQISGTATGNGFYRYAQVADTSAFATLASGFVAGTQLEAVHYRNRFFLFNGATAAGSATAVNTNMVVYSSATAPGTVPSTRQHGMLPVRSTPIVTATGGTFSQTVTGYYEYWTTEVATSIQDDVTASMESTFAGTPATFWVTSVSMVPLIQRPDIVNTAAATHWRVYRSPKKDRQSDTKFPTGFMIGSDISIGATSMQDTQTVTSTASGPANFNGIADGATVYIDMGASVTAASADGGADASMAVSSGLIGLKKQGFYGFNLGGFVGPVQGIEVTVEALTNTGTVPVSVTLARGRQSNGSWIPHVSDYVSVQNAFAQTLTKLNTVTKAFTATTSRTQYVLGSPTDRWFPADATAPFRDSDFTASGFMIVLGIASVTNVTLSVDFVSLKVYYGGSTDTTIVFPTVAYTFGDIVAQVGKNGPPPSSSTGDLYEDALVVNDMSNPAFIRYSAPGDPEAFPGTYFLDFETRDNDNVTCIKTVNSRLVIGLQTAIFRANYLPSERDASFDRGKAIEPISRSYGIVNPMCAAVFSRDGGPETLAFVSDHGIHGTDGFSFDTYTDGLDWSQIISRTGTSNAIALINDRDRQELLFYFRNDDLGNETYQCLHLSYASDHWQERPKISGPVHMRNFLSAGSLRASVRSAWTARRTSGAQDVFIGYGGTATGAGGGYVYRETGTTIPAQDDRLQWATRRMYLADMGNEWRANEVYGYVGSYSGSPQITYSLSSHKTNDSGATALGSKSITLGGQRLHRVTFNTMSEGLTITAMVTASAFAIDSLVIDGEGWGIEDSGR